MRLTSREKDIIAVVALSADKPATELARALKMPLHQFHYLIGKLTNTNVLKKVWIIDSFKLGYTRYNIFFSLSGVNQKARSALIRELSEAPQTVFFSEIGGDFDFELSILARSTSEVLRFIKQLSSKYGDLFLSKVISTRHTMTHFPRKYLSTRRSIIESVKIGGDVQPISIDELDNEILTTISASPNLSRREIARTIKRPEATIDFRVKKLIDAQILKGAIWTTNALIYGAQTFKLILQIKGFGETLSEDLHAFASKHPHVTTFIEGFGHWDYELSVEVTDYSQLRNLREQLFVKFGEYLNEVKIMNRFLVHKYRSFANMANLPT